MQNSACGLQKYQIKIMKKESPLYQGWNIQAGILLWKIMFKINYFFKVPGQSLNLDRAGVMVQ